MINTVLVFGLGVWEIVIIVAVILLLVGGKKIPEMMTGLAKGIKGFKKEMKEPEEKADEQ